MWWVYYCLAAIVALFTFLYFYGTKNYGHFKKLRFPHILPKMPFFGNFTPMMLGKQSMAEMLKDLYDQFEGLPLVGMFEFTSPVILLRDPELIKLVTVKDFDHFADRVNLVTEDIEPLLARNLLGLQGQKWRDMRSMLSPSFTTSKMKAMFNMVRECGQQMGDFIEKKCKQEESGTFEAEMKDLFARYTNDVIATSAFGIHVNSLQDQENQFFTIGKDLIKFSGIRLLIFIGYRISKRFMKLLGVSVMNPKSKAFFSSLIIDTMEEREKNNIIRPDMIHLMMEARKEGLKPAKENERKLDIDLSDETVTAQALIFFLAGFDTASTSLCFLSHMLAENPDVQRKLQAEVDAAVRADDGKISYDTIASLKYLDMCISEGLRLWPPGAASNRQCAIDYEFPATSSTPAYKISKGEGVWIPLYALHRDPLYFEKPDTFDPERFSDENKDRIQPFTYMPFGTGPRNCIGMRFALMELKIAVVSIMSRFDLSLSEKTKTPLKLVKSFVMSVEGGFWLKFKPRVVE